MHSFTDDGNAQRLFAAFGDFLRYSPETGWLVFDGKRWTRSKEHAVRLSRYTMRQIREELERLPEDADEKARASLSKWAHVSLSASKITAALDLTRSETDIAIEQADLNPNPWLLNLPNGVLDLETMKLLEHDPKFLQTKIAGTGFEPEAKCPNWLEVMKKITGDNPELTATLQQAVGYSLTGFTNEHCMFILYGTGANGKSTFLDTIRSMLGGYSIHAPANTFMVNRSAGPRDDIAMLHDRRLVTASEGEQGARLSESLIKTATGDAALTARFLYGKFFQFVPKFKLWLATNHKPRVTGSDEGIWRRLRLVPFTQHISEDSRDSEILSKLAAEHQGILNWALSGLQLWVSQGKHLKLDEMTLAATDEYREDEDLIAKFLEDSLVVSRGTFITAHDVFAAHQLWSQSEGLKPVSMRWLIIQLKEKGLVHHRTKLTRGFKDLALSNAARETRDREAGSQLRF